MKILFLTLVSVKSFEETHNIYAGLCLQLIKQGNTVQIVCPANQAVSSSKYEVYAGSSGIVTVKTGRIEKAGLLRKGISTLLIGSQFKRAIRKYLSGNSFDMVIYSTPPITLGTVVRMVKKRDHAVAYLLLKDIFPQNAVDLGMMVKSGPKSVLYRYFRRKEQQLYALSDFIGCMSLANVRYLLKNNPKLDPAIVHVSPNSFEPRLCRMSEEDRRAVREKYHIPQDKTVFIYGGNIGAPQGCSFIIECMKAVANNPNAFIIICGSGTGYRSLEQHAHTSGQKNLLMMPYLPREEYETFVGCCNVGLIFLDYRFTIPNFPSRLLSYMQKCMPVLACTDRATDLSDVLESGGFGWWCPSNDAASFARQVAQIDGTKLSAMGEKAGEYLLAHYTHANSAQIITDKYHSARN